MSCEFSYRVHMGSIFRRKTSSVAPNTVVMKRQISAALGFDGALRKSETLLLLEFYIIHISAVISLKVTVFQFLKT